VFEGDAKVISPYLYLPFQLCEYEHTTIQL